MKPMQWRRDDFVVTTDPGRFDLNVIHDFLANEACWSLAMSDAHGLYRKFGFTPLAAPERFMELFNPDVYRSPD